MSWEDYNTCTSSMNAKNNTEAGRGGLEHTDRPKGLSYLDLGNGHLLSGGFVLGEAKYKVK